MAQTNKPRSVASGLVRLDRDRAPGDVGSTCPGQDAILLGGLVRTCTAGVGGLDVVVAAVLPLVDNVTRQGHVALVVELDVGR